jgi:hypothetical protein
MILAPVFSMSLSKNFVFSVCVACTCVVVCACVRLYVPKCIQVYPSVVARTGTKTKSRVRVRVRVGWHAGEMDQEVIEDEVA